jgi:hypothetical protein
MLTGPPLPLPARYPLSQLLDQVRPQETLGAWMRQASRTLEIHCCLGGRIWVSADLGFLLRQCSRVALRKEQEPLLLEAAELIRWRALQVVTATPYLPEVQRLSDIFPGADPTPTGFQVLLQSRGPEEVLADCLTHAIPVSGSRIVYSPPPEGDHFSG